MTQERAKELLNKLFITKKRDNGEEFICYNDEGDKLGAFEKGTDLNLLYEAVSGVMFNSGLSHGFSYEIASRAVDIVAEMEDITDGEEDLTEAIDGAVPIYTFDLMEIYKADSASVDEAAEEYGNDGDSTARAQRAWYMEIRNAVEAIRSKVAELIDEPENA